MPGRWFVGSKVPLLLSTPGPEKLAVAPGGGSDAPLALARSIVCVLPTGTLMFWFVNVGVANDSYAPISIAEPVLRRKPGPRWSKAGLTAAPSVWLSALVLLVPRVTVTVLPDTAVTTICSLSIWITKPIPAGNGL